ncbi:MAG: hypothetical protein P9M00_07310 [Candidatus Tritonobacter lacicola]|nr:hypothetical protein [Candidatus Tritonobacter lacicola]
MDDLLKNSARANLNKYVYLFWTAFIISAGLLTFEYSATKRTGLAARYQNLLGAKKAGLWLAENADPSAKISLGFVGAIPYYSHLNTVDIWGITNKEIAHQPFNKTTTLGPGHFKHNAGSVLGEEPDIIIFNGCTIAVPDEIAKPQNPAERELYEHPLFSSRYRHECVQLGKDCYFRFYINKGRADKVIPPPR